MEERIFPHGMWSNRKQKEQLLRDLYAGSILITDYDRWNLAEAQRQKVAADLATREFYKQRAVEEARRQSGSSQPENISAEEPSQAEIAAHPMVPSGEGEDLVEENTLGSLPETALADQIASEGLRKKVFSPDEENMGGVLTQSESALADEIARDGLQRKRFS